MGEGGPDGHPERSQRRESSPRQRGYEPRVLARGRCAVVAGTEAWHTARESNPASWVLEAQPGASRCSASDVALRRPDARVVPPEGLEPSSATFVASCPIRGTVASCTRSANDRSTGAGERRRALGARRGSRRRWRPHRRGWPRQPLTRAGHLRGGAPGASLTRSPECRYLRPVIVTVTNVSRPERPARARSSSRAWGESNPP